MLGAVVQPLGHVGAHMGAQWGARVGIHLELGSALESWALACDLGSSPGLHGMCVRHIWGLSRT